MARYNLKLNMRYLGAFAALGLGVLAYLYLKDPDAEIRWITEEVGVFNISGIFQRLLVQRQNQDHQEKDESHRLDLHVHSAGRDQGGGKAQVHDS